MWREMSIDLSYFDIAVPEQFLFLAVFWYKRIYQSPGQSANWN